MKFYQILTEKKLPVTLLTYASENKHFVGQVVKVPIRGKEYFGVVIKKIKKDNSLGEEELFKAGRIQKIIQEFPVIFSQNQLNFLFSTAYNTFNKPADVLSGMLTAIKYFNKGNLKALESFNLEEKSKEIILKNSLEIKSEQKSDLNKTRFYLENKVSLRISYIIRTKIYPYLEQKKPVSVLIIFPEKKLLEKIYKELLQETFFENLKLNIYTGTNTKQSRETVLEIIKNDQTKLNIVLGTRSALFLPYKNLSHLFVIDEANSLYIQDQNSLYYDARDVSFVLSKSFSCQLIFISQTPSIRLLQFYSNEVLNKFMLSNTKKEQKPLILQLSKREHKNTFFNLFSEQILPKIGVEYKNPETLK